MRKIAECFGEVCKYITFIHVFGWYYTEVCKYITFIHVFGGCYTTSGIFDQEKLSILKLIGKSIRSGDAVNIFFEK